MTGVNRDLYAYEIHGQSDMPIENAPIERDWMELNDRFAYRCLPMTIANQSGWFIKNPAGFSAVWNGGPSKHDLKIVFDDSFDKLDLSHRGVPVQIVNATVGAFSEQQRATGDDSHSENRIVSHFGSGIVTFTIPYLFRTPPNINLWIKGPTNRIKAGAQALEGVVESDWSVSTFTMNWKLTTIGQPVRFEREEPICMIVPQTRGLSEQLLPKILPLSHNHELHEEFNSWQESRSEFNQGLANGDQNAVERKWEKHYFQGHTNRGSASTSHQTRLHLKPFEQNSAT